MLLYLIFNSMLLGKFSLLSFWRSQSIFIFSCHRKQMGKFLKNLFVLVLFCCFCLPSLYKKCVCKTMSLISELNLQVVINRQPGSIITSEKWVDLKIQKRLLFFWPWWNHLDQCLSNLNTYTSPLGILLQGIFWFGSSQEGLGPESSGF